MFYSLVNKCMVLQRTICSPLIAVNRCTISPLFLLLVKTFVGFSFYTENLAFNFVAIITIQTKYSQFLYSISITPSIIFYRGFIIIIWCFLAIFMWFVPNHHRCKQPWLYFCFFWKRDSIYLCDVTRSLGPLIFCVFENLSTTTS